MNAAGSIFVIRLSAMGDILHALPAVTALKRTFPDRKIIWLVARRWIPLLEGNSAIDRLIVFDRRDIRNLRDCWRDLRGLEPALAIDFQGLVQSAIAGRASHPEIFYGFDAPIVRERLAPLLYTHAIATRSAHRIDRNVELAEIAVGTKLTRAPVWIPPGSDEAELPAEPFVLASPLAGWAGKQWPLENYARLATLLRAEGMELVANVPELSAHEVAQLKGMRLHRSSIAGLIAATRRATAVLGVDSGPLHLAAALEKRGVALFGPTDPAQTGPYGGTISVLRAPYARTTYKRHTRVQPSMAAVTVDEVFQALMHSVAAMPVATAVHGA